MSELNEVQHEFIRVAFDNIEPAFLNADQQAKLGSMASYYKRNNWLSSKQLLFIQRLKYKTDATKRSKYLAKYGTLDVREQSSPARRKFPKAFDWSKEVKNANL